MRTKRELPIRVCFEPIDGAACAVVASCVIAQRGWWRGFGVFTIITTAEPARWRRWQYEGREAFMRQFEAYHGLLPYICRVDDPFALVFG